MKTWKLTVNEEELKALICFHSEEHSNNANHAMPDVERSARIHDLTKRLNRKTPEVETDPRPNENSGIVSNTERATTTW